MKERLESQFALCIENKGCEDLEKRKLYQVLPDERLGRRVARTMGLPVKGTVGVLLAAFHVDLLTKSQTQDLPR